MLGQALSGYGLEDDERIHAARTLRSAFHGFAHLEAGDGHPHSHVNLDDSFDRMVDPVVRRHPADGHGLRLIGGPTDPEALPP